MSMRKGLLFVVFIISLVVSSLFYWTNIDPDYYSFYYVGRGIVHGQNMFRDFADNKGPVLYLIFAGLNIVFGRNYGLALVIGSTLLDFFVISILLVLINEWWKKGNGDICCKWWFAVGITIIYKAFTLGMYMGGIYSESVGNIFLFLTMLLWVRKRYWWSGILFTLAFFCRQSFLLFLPIFFIEFLRLKNTSAIFKWLIAMVFATSLVLGYLYLSGSWIYFWRNAVLFQGNYAIAVQGLHWLSVGLLLVNDLKILWLITVLWVSVLVMLARLSFERFRLIMLILCSVVATLGIGISFPHHYFQMFLAVASVLSMLVVGNKKAKRVGVFGLVSGVLVALASILFSVNLGAKNGGGLKTTTLIYPEISSKKYMVVVPYYPRYYLDYNRSAPDRYYQQFFLSSVYNSDPHSNIDDHLGLTKDKLSATAFLVLDHSTLDNILVKEYLNNFGETFGLKIVYNDDNKIKIYEAKK